MKDLRRERYPLQWNQLKNICGREEKTPRAFWKIITGDKEEDPIKHLPNKRLQLNAEQNVYIGQMRQHPVEHSIHE